MGSIEISTENTDLEMPKSCDQVTALLHKYAGYMKLGTNVEKTYRLKFTQHDSTEDMTHSNTGQNSGIVTYEESMSTLFSP